MSSTYSNLCKFQALTRPPSILSRGGWGGRGAPVDWPFFFFFLPPCKAVADGGSLAASPSQFAGKHGASPSPRGAGRGLQSNVVTRQPGARGRQKSGGSRKRPVLAEDRLLGLGFSGRGNGSPLHCRELNQCTHVFFWGGGFAFQFKLLDIAKTVSVCQNNESEHKISEKQQF